MRKEYPVKVTRVTDGPQNGRETSKHPAFGQVSLSRVRGSVKLYGSALDRHDEFIVLRVTRSELNHDLGRNWYYADNKSIVELALSPAQFADMITGLNIGGGVPCTLWYIEGQEVPAIPWDHETESKKVVDSFKREVQETVENLNQFVEQMQSVLNKSGTITKAERDGLSRVLDKFNQLYKDNAPFMVEQFQNAAAKVVTSAKAEVEAFAHRVTVETGVKVLTQASETPEQKRLREGAK